MNAKGRHSKYNYKAFTSKGFYTTSNLEQAVRWAHIKQEREEAERAEAAILQLKAYKTYDQLSFHTDRVIKTLKFVESIEI